MAEATAVRPPLRRGSFATKPPPRPPCAPAKQTGPFSRNGAPGTVCPGPALLLLSDALRRCELVALNVEDVSIVGGGAGHDCAGEPGNCSRWGLIVADQSEKDRSGGQRAEIGLACRHQAETCLVLAFEARQEGRVEKPSRWFEGSVLGVGLATPRCIPTRFAGSWRIG